MRMINATPIVDASLTASSVVESGVAAYSGATSYGAGDMAAVTVGSTVTIYESLQAANLNNSPASSPLWWRERSVTYPVYSGATSYAVNDIVISTATHRVYKSLVGTNMGNALTDVSKWSDIGPTNRWAPFDLKVGTKASRVGDMSYTLVPGTADALGILDTNAESATLTIKVGVTTVYTATKYLNVSGAGIDDWYEYFTSPVGTKTNITFENLPLYSGASWVVTITGRNTSSYVSVGTIGVGASRPLGKTESKAKVRIIDFTQKTTDIFGIVSATERGFSKKMSLRTLIDTNDVDSVNAALTAVRAVPTIYIGESGFDSMLAYGYWDDFEIEIADGRMDASGQLYDGTKSFLNITVVSLTTSL